MKDHLMRRQWTQQLFCLSIVVACLFVLVSCGNEQTEMAAPAQTDPAVGSSTPVEQTPVEVESTAAEGQGEEEATESAPTAEQDAVIEVSHGEEVNVEDYVVPGKTTIVDFYSDFCPPCVELAPRLHDLAESRDDVRLVVVDINRPDVKGIDWDSPVAQQYELGSIPYLRVYGPDGTLQTEGDEALILVQDMMQQ